VSDPAYAHYTVEREASDEIADPRRTFVQALKWGWRGSFRRIADFLLRKRARQVLIDPQVAFHIADVVRVKDRAGVIVLSERFDNPYKSEARHTQITSDLLRLDVARFRDVYGIDPAEHGEV
jgi:hypothetical protein